MTDNDRQKINTQPHVKSLAKKRIAILGNGQLANMLIEASQGLNLDVTSFVLPKVDVDAETITRQTQQYRDLLQGFDVITYEIENIFPGLLQALTETHSVFPSISALTVSQDRFFEKSLFSELTIPTNEYLKIDSFNDLLQAAEQLSFPFVLKQRRFGYDGKGQSLVQSETALKTAWQTLGAYPLIAERFVNFDFEISQVASRDQFGNIAFYPLVRNEHRDGILRESHLLKNDGLQKKAQTIVGSLLTHFDYVGTFAVEFFVKGGVLYANETAPRVHNSGHWSIDGANISQFENHLLAVSGYKVKQVALKHPYSMMINLIGEDVPNTLKTSPHIKAKSYHKTLRKGRKMGHINIVADDKEAFLNAKTAVYQQLQANPCLQQSDAKSP